MADWSALCSFINFGGIGFYIRLRQEYDYVLKIAYVDDYNVIKVYENVKTIRNRPNILLNEKRPLLLQQDKFDFLFKLTRLINEYIELYEKLEGILLDDGGYSKIDRHEFCIQRKGQEVIWSNCERLGISPSTITKKAEEIINMIRSEKQKMI